MRSTSRAVLATGTAAGAAALVAAVRRKRQVGPTHGRSDGWVAVTVLATSEQVAPGGEFPAPLRELGDAVELRMRPAPGDRGTELYARPATSTASSARPGLAGRLTGQDALAPLRTALREAKALVETGAIVRSDESRTTHPGPAGRLLQAVDRASQGAGRL